MEFKPTDEQLDIISEATSSKTNLLISALAGAAKTTTLTLIAEALPKKAILCLAFNKRIAVEMAQRLPDNCECSTLNSLGHRAWGRMINQRIKINKDKSFKILKEYIALQGKAEREELSDDFTELLGILRTAKSAGWVPEKKFPEAKKLWACDDDFFDSQELILSFTHKLCLRKCMLQSIEMAYEGELDFADQLYMSTLWPTSFKAFDIILVDEAQDLSALNHLMLKKIVGISRLIAVGDHCQAIYGFRGAHSKSMDQLRKQFKMEELTLSICFRCPESVCDVARERAPRIQCRLNAPYGEVRTMQSWDLTLFPRSAAIICRNNAPLFSLAVKCLKAGVGVEIIGRDIGAGIIKVMKSLGEDDLSQREAMIQLSLWRKKEEARLRHHGALNDKYECIYAFLEETEDLGHALTHCDAVLNMTAPIQLMTGHKSKGLEFDNVFILNKSLLSLNEDALANGSQDHNLHYVMVTRSCKTLTYIDTKGLDL